MTIIIPIAMPSIFSFQARFWSASMCVAASFVKISRRNSRDFTEFHARLLLGRYGQTTVIGMYLLPEDVAERWHLSPRTLANWRSSGDGPRYLKVGRSVLYSLKEIEAFEQAGLRDPTAR
jgi:hypothetical protein